MADVLLVVHFMIVAFIVGGLPLTWLGFLLGWKWIGNPIFRYLHLAAIAFVALEALLGYACPLTVWEDLLRGGIRAGKFRGAHGQGIGGEFTLESQPAWTTRCREKWRS